MHESSQNQNWVALIDRLEIIDFKKEEREGRRHIGTADDNLQTDVTRRYLSCERRVLYRDDRV